MANKRVLNSEADHENFKKELRDRDVDPETFSCPPDRYPAVVVWVEHDCNAMLYTSDAYGDYVYQDDFGVSAKAS